VLFPYSAEADSIALGSMGANGHFSDSISDNKDLAGSNFLSSMT
jgi:hypothetical protein